MPARSSTRNSALRVSRGASKPDMPKRQLPGSSRRQKGNASSSLRDQACEQIKHLIITCAFRPGEYINELQLSSMLNIGRTPVHQALDRLMIEGLVEVIPRKGVIVKPITLNEVLNIIDLRLLNESYCARLAAARADANDIATLSEILKNTEHWSNQRDVEKMMLLDREFHQAVAKASKNEILADLLKALQERSLRFWFISLNEPGHFRSVQQEHFEVLKGILERDPDMAEQAMRLHIESFRSNVSKFL